MIIFDIVGDEQNLAYQDLSIDNLERQYDFLRSLITAAVSLQRPMISTAIIKTLNMHAIACLHVSAGEYRPCEVDVGGYKPPDYYRIPELMNEFVNEVNYNWQNTDAIALATYVLWRVNHLHPFINGNGRTARALCYYVICVKSGGLLKGSPLLPELIRHNRNEYVDLLQEVDRRFQINDPDFIVDLHAFITRLVIQQLNSAP